MSMRTHCWLAMQKLDTSTTMVNILHIIDSVNDLDQALEIAHEYSHAALRSSDSRYASLSPPPHTSIEWVYQKLISIGLIPITYSNGSALSACLPARRGDRTESILLAMTVCGRNCTEPEINGDAVGMGMVISYVHKLKAANWRAKDILVMVTVRNDGVLDDDMMQHMASLHHENKGQLSSIADCGRLQAGIMIDARESVFGDRSASRLLMGSDLLISAEGLNGALPNLDLINVIDREASRVGLSVYHADPRGIADYRCYNMSDYVSMIGCMTMESIQLDPYTMIGSMITHGSRTILGTGSGAHRHFISRHVDVVTLHLLPSRDASLRTPSGPNTRYLGIPPVESSRSFVKFDNITIRSSALLSISRVAMATIRDLNNLEERLHHAYFLYFLSLPQRFLPIGSYVPVYGVLFVAFAMRLFHWHHNFKVAYGQAALIVGVAELFGMFGFALFSYVSPGMASIIITISASLMIVFVMPGTVKDEVFTGTLILNCTIMMHSLMSLMFYNAPLAFVLGIPTFAILFGLFSFRAVNRLPRLLQLLTLGLVNPLIVVSFAAGCLGFTSGSSLMAYMIGAWHQGNVMNFPVMIVLYVPVYIVVVTAHVKR